MPQSKTERIYRNGQVTLTTAIFRQALIADLFERLATHRDCRGSCMAGGPIRIEDAKIVWLGKKRVCVTASDSKMVDNQLYVRLLKSESLTCNLMNVKRTKDMARPLSHTDILEQLVALRNKKYKEVTKLPVEETLSIFDTAERKSKKNAAAALHELPEVLTIMAPTIDDIDGIEIKTTLEKPHVYAVYVECSTNVIEYLSKVCRYQIDAGAVKRQHPRTAADEKINVEVRGVTPVYRGKSAGGFRVQYNDGCKVKTKRIRTGDGDTDLNAAIVLRSSGWSSSTPASADEHRDSGPVTDEDDEKPELGEVEQDETPLSPSQSSCQSDQSVCSKGSE